MQNEENFSLGRRREALLLADLRMANDRSARYGLKLSERAITELAITSARALTDHGRVEFGAWSVIALIDGFCDSPYLLQEDYETVLPELVDAFYYFKNACGDTITDEELILAMRERFDAYDGSADAVIGTSLEALCRARRIGLEDDLADDDDWEEDMDEQE